MSEERIAERIDMNLLNLTVDEMAVMSKEMFKKRVENLKNRTIGKLKIKEYPTSTAGSASFRALLNDLKTKQNFVPDIIYIDYINICISSRVKMSGSINSYTYIKMIAEELRGIAVEFNVPVVSATQLTRSGFTSSDVGLEDTSESFGLPSTSDLFIALISDEELESQNQIVIKQLKNRYGDLSKYRRFIVGIDRAHMRLYDAEDSAQRNLMDGPEVDKPVFDSSSSNEKFSKDKFKDLW
jgi:replicative DNA helicase